jgi:hypothetical protein
MYESLVGLIITAFVGALLGALLAWAGSNEAFDGRKFFVLFVPMLLAGLGFAAAIDITKTLTFLDFLSVLLASAGFSSMIKHGVNVYNQRQARRAADG